MMIEMIDTGVKQTAAAHLELPRNGMLGVTDSMTVVWSTSPVSCDCGSPGALTIECGPDNPPRVWDSSGLGDWDLVTVQCSCCGQLCYPDAELRGGHLRGAALKAVARMIRRRLDEQAEQVRERLERLLAEVAADLEAVGGMSIDDLPDADAGEMMEPGVGVSGDELVAWDYDPRDPGEFIEVVRPVPQRVNEPGDPR